ncbi:MAG TPA: zf-HC2 domain-containing protein [Candidatus Dormibacteraeota bacterium]|nr:zf-HC2 domain-containing protein [Candidatus Dormibacteraeota bacterium]
MECYSEQICAIFVDDELPLDEARRLRDHLATCLRCRELVDDLRAESRVLSDSLRELPEEAASPEAFSRLGLSWAWGDLAVMAAVLALGSIVLVSIDELKIPEALEWFNPFSLSGFTNLMFNLSDYFARGGTAMLTEYAAVVGGFFLLSLLGGALLLGRRSRLRQPGLRLLIVVITLSLPGFALERRHGDFVTVPASETVEDTLAAVGNTVRVEGVIDGDLLVFGGTVEVRGIVKGDLLSFAKRTVVSGRVEGSIYDFSNSLDLDGQLGHSIYGFAQSLRVNDRGHVGEGIVAAAGDVSLEGEVKRSVDILGSGNADVSGTIGRDLTMNGGSLTLTNTARVGGNLIARVHQLKEVHIADGATIAGKRDIQVRVRQSQFMRPRFYFHQAIWLAAAMLVGWLGLVLFPGFFRATTQAVGSGWLSLGWGVGVLAGGPVAMVVAAITLIGIPISLMLFPVYLTAIYLAKVWVGAFLGQILLKPAGGTKGDWMLGLLVGLLILTIVGFVPYLGGLIRFGVVCLGLGAFAGQLYRASRPVTA